MGGEHEDPWTMVPNGANPSFRVVEVEVAERVFTRTTSLSDVWPSVEGIAVAILKLNSQ